MKTLSLRKCAYIFDNSYSNFFYGTKAQHAARMATQKAIKEYYESPEKRAEKIEYTTDENGNYIITVNGQRHRLNALQIAAVHDEPESVINHRRNIDPDEIAKETPHFHRFCTNDLYSNKYRTLQFEFFTGADALGYIRVHFNGWHEQFIIDDRTGEIYTSGENGQHKPTTAEYIRERLHIKSPAAIKEYNEMIAAITKK